MTGVQLPSYPLAPGSLLHALEHTSTVVSSSTDDDGEFFAMSLAEVTSAAEVESNAMIVVPLNEPLVDQQLDFTYAAGSSLMFIQLTARPQPRMTYGHCAAYSDGLLDQPVEIGSKFKFPTSVTFIVAKPQLVEAIRASLGLGTGAVQESESGKRQCVRPLGVGGEQADDAGEKIKGTSINLIDLEGCRHPTRTKGEIAQREADLNFVWRAMDAEKLEFCVTPDSALQVEEYRSLLCEQAETDKSDRHTTFISSGLISQIQKLVFFRDRDKLKFLITGAFQLDGIGIATLTIDDFVIGQSISDKHAVCSNHNAALTTTLKNFQTLLHIVFSNAYENCLASFIDKLEGDDRPMDLASSDFLKYSIGIILKRFFRIVRSVKTSATQESLGSPAKCANFLQGLFEKLGNDITHHPTMMRLDALYRLRVARKLEAAAAGKPESKKIDIKSAAEKPTVRWNDVSPADEKKAGPRKTCSGFFGGQIGAIRKDGRKFSCDRGKDCTYAHVSVVGKSLEKLTEIASNIAPPTRDYLLKALQSKK